MRIKLYLLILPSSVELTIESTDAAIKGQTASSSYKPATLENGIKYYGSSVYKLW